MQTYVIKFDRIGRTRDIEPLTAAVAGEADLCSAIRTYARPHLRSRDFDVMIDEDSNRGWIACGMQNGGDFTFDVSHEPDAAPAGTVVVTRSGATAGRDRA